MKLLRILFTVLSAICILFCIYLGIFINFTAALVDLALALLFFALMLVCKSKQEENEEKRAKQVESTEFDKKDEPQEPKDGSDKEDKH